MTRLESLRGLLKDNPGLMRNLNLDLSVNMAANSVLFLLPAI